jgi:microcystin-dependent protein
MPDQLIANPFRALDRNGDVVASAKAYIYQSGTMTAVTVDDVYGNPLPWPVLADIAGYFPQVFYSGGLALKVIVTDASNAVLPGYPIDPATVNRGSISAAAAVSFAPTTAIPATDVQAAIERVQANLETIDAMFVGQMAWFACISAPAGWLFANGREVSRTTYNRLLTRIGTAFGAGDGSTTFNLPDTRGVFIRGYAAASGGVDSGRVFASLQAESMLNHTHSGTTSSNGSHTHVSSEGQILIGGKGTPGTAGWTGGGTFQYTDFGVLDAAGAHTHTLTTGNPSAGGGTETRPVNLALLGCIKY